jgi:hypothetical protein
MGRIEMSEERMEGGRVSCSDAVIMTKADIEPQKMIRTMLSKS